MKQTWRSSRRCLFKYFSVQFGGFSISSRDKMNWLSCAMSNHPEVFIFVKLKSGCWRFDPTWRKSSLPFPAVKADRGILVKAKRILDFTSLHADEKLNVIAFCSRERSAMREKPPTPSESCEYLGTRGSSLVLC